MRERGLGEGLGIYDRLELDIDDGSELAIDDRLELDKGWREH
jgi:hypothetical protein